MQVAPQLASDFTNAYVCDRRRLVTGRAKLFPLAQLTELPSPSSTPLFEFADRAGLSPGLPGVPMSRLRTFGAALGLPPGVTLLFMGDENRSGKQSSAVIWARYSQIAFIIPAAIVVGLVIGRLLDSWLHTRWLYIAGVIFGAIVGFIDMIKMISRQGD